MKRLKKWLIRLGFFIASLVLFYTILFFLVIMPLAHSSHFRSYVKGHINQDLMVPMNLVMDFSALRARFFPLGVSIEGLSIRHIANEAEAESGGDFVFETEYIDARLSLRHLVIGKILLYRVILDRPSFHFSFQFLADNFQGSDAAASFDLSDGLNMVSSWVENIAVQNGRVSAQDKDGHWHIQNISFFVNLSRLFARGDFDIQDITYHSHRHDAPLAISQIKTRALLDVYTLRFFQLNIMAEDLGVNITQAEIGFTSPLRYDIWDADIYIATPFVQRLSVLPWLSNFPAEDIPDAKIHLTGAISGRGTIPTTGALTLNIEELFFGHSKIAHAVFPLRLDEGRAIISNAQVQGPFGGLTIPTLTVGLDQDMPVTGQIAPDGIRFSEFMRLFDITGCLSFYDVYGLIDVRGTLTPFDLRGRFDLDARGFHVAPTPEEAYQPDIAVMVLHNPATLGGDFTATLERTTLDNVVVASGRSSVDARATIAYTPINVIVDAHSDQMHLEDIRSIADIALAGDGALRTRVQVNHIGLFIDGIVDFANASVADYNLQAYTAAVNYKPFTLTFHNIHIARPDTDLRGEVALELGDLFEIRLRADILRANAQYIREFFGPTHAFYLDHLHEGVFSGRVSFEGDPMPSKMKGQFDIRGLNIRYMNEVFDRVAGAVVFGDARLAFESLWAEKGVHRIEVVGGLGPGSQYDLRLKEFTLPLSTLNVFSENNVNVSGSLSASGTLTGPFDDPQYAFDISLPKTVIQGHAMPAALKAKIERNSANLTFGFRSGARDWISGDMRNKAPHNFSLKADVPPIPALVIPGIVFPHLLRYPDAVTLAFAADLSGALDNIHDTLSGHLRVSAFDVRGATRALSLNEPAIFEFTPNSRARWRHNLTFTDRDMRRLDLTLASSRAEPFLAHASGELDAYFIHALSRIVTHMEGALSGNITLARRDGLWRLHSREGIKSPRLLVQLPFFPEEIVFSPFEIGVADNRVTVPAVSGDVSTGSARLSGDVFISPLDLTPQPNLHVEFANASLTIPECIRTVSDGAFSIRGEKPPYIIQGTMAVQSGTNICELETAFAPELSFFNRLSARPPVSPTARLDIRAAIDPEAFALKYNILRTPIGGDIHVSGVDTQYGLSGRIHSQSGQIAFRNHIFQISAFQLDIDADAPLSSQIFINANNQIQGYDVQMNVRGTLDEYAIEFSTFPSLPQRDIWSLVLFGYLHSELSASDQAQLLQAELGKSFIAQMPLTASMEQETGFVVQLEPVIDTETEDVQSRLSLKHRLSDRIAAEFTTSVGTEPASSFTLEYDISKKVVIRGSIGDPFLASGGAFDPARQLGLDIRLRTEFD